MRFKFVNPYLRDTLTGKIGGVCAGISNYFEIDVSLIRVIFITSIFIGPFLWILYPILWVVAPAHLDKITPCPYCKGTGEQKETIKD